MEMNDLGYLVLSVESSPRKRIKVSCFEFQLANHGLNFSRGLRLPSRDGYSLAPRNLPLQIAEIAELQRLLSAPVGLSWNSLDDAVFQARGVGPDVANPQPCALQESIPLLFGPLH